ETSSVWIMMPVIAPAMQARPADLPWLSARPTNSVMSGPGVMAMTNTATENWRMTERSGTKLARVMGRRLDENRHPITHREDACEGDDGVAAPIPSRARLLACL